MSTSRSPRTPAPTAHRRSDDLPRLRDDEAAKRAKREASRRRAMESLKARRAW